MSTPREQATSLSTSSLSNIPRPCRGLQSLSGSRLYSSLDGDRPAQSISARTPKVEAATELSTAAGSLLGRRQRMSLSDPKKRSKRIKGSPPPPKLARKRMVVSGPPQLTHQMELEVESKCTPPPLTSLADISDVVSPEDSVDVAETPSTTIPSSIEDRPSPSSSADVESQAPSSPKGIRSTAEGGSDRAITSDMDESSSPSPTAPPLGGLTTVNAGAMTCTDLAYLLSIDGFVGAIRLRDGLFLGDQLAATDQDFFNANVVLYVVNCCDSEVPNHFDNVSINNQNIQYLSFAWQDVEGEKIFSPRGTVLHKIYDFIEGADAVGASCLVHSKFGKSRAVCVVCGYLMMRYRWSAKKALEFLIARRPDLTLRRSFVRQILAMEHYLSDLYGCEMSSSWDERIPALSPEELLLRNTFKNSFAGSEGGYSMNAPQQSPVPTFARPLSKSQLRITWNGRDEIFEPPSEGEHTSRFDKPIQLPKESPLPSILKSRSLPEPTSSRTTDLSPTESKRARSLSSSPTGADKADRQRRSANKLTPPIYQQSQVMFPKSRREVLSTNVPQTPPSTPTISAQPGITSTPSLSPSNTRAANKEEARSKSKSLDKGIGLVGVAERLRPRRATNSNIASQVQSDAAHLTSEAASLSTPLSRPTPLGISKRQINAKHNGTLLSPMRSAVTSTHDCVTSRGKAAAKSADSSLEHTPSGTNAHGAPHDTKVLWGSPRIQTPVLTLDLESNVLKRRLASQPAKAKGKSRSLSPVVSQSMKPVTCSTPAPTTLQMPIHRIEHQIPLHQLQNRSPPQVPPPLHSPQQQQIQHRGSLSSLLSPLKAAFSSNRSTSRGSDASLHPWRTTIADLPLQDASYGVVHELNSSLEASSPITGSVKRSSLQSLGKQQPQSGYQRVDESLFTVPRGQQRVASNTVEYRQSRPLANTMNLRLRAISSSRASLPKSDYPSSALMGLKREPEPSRHNTLPPSPKAKVQVQRSELLWESGFPDFGRGLTTGLPSQIKPTSDAPSTSHISYRDGIAITKHIAYTASPAAEIAYT